MTSNTERKREQMQFVSMDDLVPQDHMLRLIDKAIPILTEEPFLCNCKCSMPPGQRLKYHIEKMIDP